MPNTDIFSGNHYHKTSQGGINVIGLENKALITLINQSGIETSAEIQVYNLNELEQIEAFQALNALIVEEPLIHQWKTKENDTTVIKYAGADQLALIFRCKNNAKAHFNTLLKSHILFNVDYISEVNFDTLIKQKSNINILALKEIASDTAIQMLCDNYHYLKILLNKGFELRSLVQLDTLKLEKLLSFAPQINDVLKFITIDQIQGIDQKLPPMKQSYLKPNNEIISLGYGMGSNHDFLYQYTGNAITITYSENNAQLKLNFNYYYKGKNIPIDPKTNTLTANLSLIHQWQQYQNNTNGTVTYYAPELNLIQNEISDPDFPEELFDKNSPLLSNEVMLMTPYYKEYHFVNYFLPKHGTTLEALKATQGMTQQKLKLMMAYALPVEQLLKKGLTFEDFAQINTLRLEYILSNFTKAEMALELADPKLVLGLKTENTSTIMNNETYVFFKSVDHTSCTNTCMIL